jgi:hypothetical protein
MAAQYAADAGEDVTGWTAQAFTLAPALDAARRPFVVILEDPDGMGESPWTCYGADLAEAIADARRHWAAWAEDDETRPEVRRAYPGSIGDILDLPADINGEA